MLSAASRRNPATCQRPSRGISHTVAAAVCACALVATLGSGCAERPTAPHRSKPTQGKLAGVISRGIVAVSQAPTTIPSGKLTGARIVLVDAAKSEIVSILTEGFRSAGKPNCSFDGKRILFAGAKANADAPAIWEIGVDGSGLRKVTECPGGCAQAIYLSTIYTIDAVAPEDQIAFVTLPTMDAPSTIYSCRLDGAEMHPVTFASKGVSDPTILSDGRLIFSMAAPSESDSAEEGVVENTALFTINTDGTDVFPFAGLHGAAASRTAPCQVDANTVVYSECDGTGCKVISVARTRSLHSRRIVRNIAGERIHALSPMPGGKVLVSHSIPRRGTAPLRRLSILDANDGKVIASVLDDPKWHALDAVWVGPRSKPPGRSSVVNHDGSVAQLYCLNVYLSDQSIQRDRDFEIETVRVFSNSLSPTDLSGPKLLGEARVESDGSFFVELPARTPLQLASVGLDGKMLDRMQSFFWVMPGERRGCIGCHEDREMTPPNRHVFALRRPAQRIGLPPVARAKSTRAYGSRKEPK